MNGIIHYKIDFSHLGVLERIGLYQRSMVRFSVGANQQGIVSEIQNGTGSHVKGRNIVWGGNLYAVTLCRSNQTDYGCCKGKQLFHTDQFFWNFTMVFSLFIK